MCWHAVGTCRRSNELQATAVLVLDAFDETTADVWLSRDLGLRRLERSRKNQIRLWMPLS
jgi:hypothetical protein